jgi:tetratricopeptide (TPR) repeat protein
MLKEASLYSLNAEACQCLGPGTRNLGLPLSREGEFQMSLKLPAIKQTAWLSLIPHLLIISIFMILASIAGVGIPALIGVGGYIFLSVILKKTLARYHQRGMAYLKAREFEQALRKFQLSYDFFSRYRWVDKWRFIILLSSSRMCFQEMALLNMAYCYGQLGRKDKARELYNRTLTEFPESAMASAAIQVLDSPTLDQAQP